MSGLFLCLKPPGATFMTEKSEVGVGEQTTAHPPMRCKCRHLRVLHAHLDSECLAVNQDGDWACGCLIFRPRRKEGGAV